MTSSIKPTCFKIDTDNDKMYYNSKELKEYAPEFYYGCKIKQRNIIEKKKIPETEFIYANLKKNEWILSSAVCKKAQLLLSKEWVERNIFKNTESTQSSVERLNTNGTENINEEEEKQQDIEANENIKKAPPLLHLNNSEKFKDRDNNIIEIETRGEKSRNMIYFKVQDVIRVFEMSRLNDTLIDSRGCYENNIHYKKFFISVKSVENGNSTIKKQLYLTYKGLTRILFASNAGNAEKFQDWAENKLFTIQMGNEEERIKLGAKLVNISVKTFRAVMNKHANKFPCIYLISLGNVGLLRETFKITDVSIPDDSIIYKYGFTDDLNRRLGEHQEKYGKLENVKLDEATFNIIDPKYTCAAERDIRDECNAYEINLETEGFNELIILNKKQLKCVIKRYGQIGREYAGHSAELQEQILKHNNEIERLKTLIETNEKYHKLEIERLTTRIETNEKYHKLEIDNKNLENENLKLQIKISNI